MNNLSAVNDELYLLTSQMSYFYPVNVYTHVPVHKYDLD